MILIDCAVKKLHLRDGGHGDTWVDYGCRHPACMDCWDHRCVRVRSAIKKHIDYNSAEKAVWLLTWSIRNAESIPLAYSELKHVEQKFRSQHQAKVRNGQDSVWGQVDNFVGVFEIKRGNDLGWNVHSHKLITTLSPFIDFGHLQKDWKKAADDDAAHLDVARGRPIVDSYREGHSDLAVSYLAPYLTKSKGIWGGMTESDAQANSDFLKGKRFLRRTRGTAPPPVKSDLVTCCIVPEEGLCKKNFESPWGFNGPVSPNFYAKF